MNSNARIAKELVGLARELVAKIDFSSMTTDEEKIDGLYQMDIQENLNKPLQVLLKSLKNEYKGLDDEFLKSCEDFNKRLVNPACYRQHMD